MDLKPIALISSVEHLKLYDEIIKNATFKDKFFYNYPMPDYFPQANNQPIGYFSSGEITLRKDEIAYQSKEIKIGSFRKHFLSKINNLEELSFVLNPSQIKSVEWYYYKHPREFTKRRFIRIICDKNVMDGDFLIRIDGESNYRLFKMLTQFKDGLEITTSLKDINVKMIYLGYFGLFLFILSFIVMRIPYETFRSYGDTLGITPAFIIIPALIILIISFLWYLTKLNNRKVYFHWNVFTRVIIVFMCINIILNHFYP